MKGFFIVGTDTGVGKTVLAGWVLTLMRGRGIDAVPMKPVQTGCEIRRGRITAPDLEFCLRAAKLDPDREERSLMCPYVYKPACSPHLAAGLEGRPIRIPRMMQAFRKLAERHDSVIVEGAGGILVPLNRRSTLLDLIKIMKLPVLIAARPGLGTLNHTFLTVNELRRAECAIAGIVLVESGPPGKDAIEKDNRKTLRRSGIPVLGRLKYRARLSPEDVRNLATDGLTRNMLELIIPRTREL